MGNVGVLPVIFNRLYPSQTHVGTSVLNSESMYQILPSVSVGTETGDERGKLRATVLNISVPHQFRVVSINVHSL